jgi:hypothetical protein
MKIESKVKAVKAEKSYGNLTLNSKEMPSVKDCKLNDVIQITATCRVDTLRSPDIWDIQERGMKATDVLAHVIITKLDVHKPSTKKEDKK